MILVFSVFPSFGHDFVFRKRFFGCSDIETYISRDLRCSSLWFADSVLGLLSLPRTLIFLYLYNLCSSDWIFRFRHFGFVFDCRWIESFVVLSNVLILIFSVNVLLNGSWYWGHGEFGMNWEAASLVLGVAEREWAWSLRFCEGLFWFLVYLYYALMLCSNGFLKEGSGGGAILFYMMFWEGQSDCPTWKLTFTSALCVCFLCAFCSLNCLWTLSLSKDLAFFWKNEQKSYIMLLKYLNLAFMAIETTNLVWN